MSKGWFPSPPKRKAFKFQGSLEIVKRQVPPPIRRGVSKGPGVKLPNLKPQGIFFRSHSFENGRFFFPGSSEVPFHAPCMEYIYLDLPVRVLVEP